MTDEMIDWAKGWLRDRAKECGGEVATIDFDYDDETPQTVH
jgi:hypothetical protein